MTANAVGRCRSGGHVLYDLGGMTMGMAVEIGFMALGAGAAIATIDRGIAMAVNANPPAAIYRIVTGGTGEVNRTDDIAGMAVGAECCRSHRGGMAVAVVGEIRGMATGTGGTPNNGSCPGPIDRVFERWRRGVAVSTTVVVNRHLAIRRMTERHAGRRILEDSKPCRGVIDREVGCRSRLIQMTVEAVDDPRIIGDDILHRGAHRSLRIDIASGVMTGGADAEMAGEDIRPILHRVAVGAGLRINLAQICRRGHGDRMINCPAGRAMVMAGEIAEVAVDALAGAI